MSYSVSAKATLDPSRFTLADVATVCPAVPSVAAGVEARMKGNSNGPAGGRGGRGEGRGRGGGRGGGRGYDRPARDEGESFDAPGGERGGRARVQRGGHFGRRNDNDRHDGTGRG
jgi:hypothetical protein